MSKRNNGLELEYSFPQSYKKIPQSEAWKLPARVLIKPDLTLELLNEPEINDRLHQFLEQNPKMKEYCEQSVFTWTAITVHCKTNHVIDVIKGYNLNLGVVNEGRVYVEPGVLQPVPLILESSTEDKSIYTANFVVNPSYLQTEFEEATKLVANFSGSSFESVMNSQLRLSSGQSPIFSGTRVVNIEVLPSGTVVRLKRESITKIKGGGGFLQTQTATETIERHPVD